MVVEPVNTSAPGRVRCRGTRWPAVDAFAAVDSVAHMMPAKRSREKD